MFPWVPDASDTRFSCLDESCPAPPVPTPGTHRVVVPVSVSGNRLWLSLPLNQGWGTVLLNSRRFIVPNPYTHGLFPRVGTWTVGSEE